MKSVVVKEFYDTLEQLHVSEVPKPSPKEDELLIEVIAAGVNFVDTLYVRASTRYLLLITHSSYNHRLVGNTRTTAL